MDFNDISQLRLVTQQIAQTKFNSIKDIVGWMGAMQAQDYSMAKWAIGVRLLRTDDKAIEEAFNKGDILRTHLLRPTLHFVVADDIYWMLELTAQRIKARMKSRHKALGLTATRFAETNHIIERALASGKHLTRFEIVSALKKAKIHCDNEQAFYHLILNAELDGIICSGTIKDKKQTYALLAQRVPKKKIFNRNEALAKLAIKYFASHGPATLQDFVWWSSLSISEARKAIELTGLDLIAEKIGPQVYWVFRSFFSQDIKEESVHLLPAYDEFLISYKDRNPSISTENHKRTISSNGIFRPVIVLRGQVIGIWKRRTRTNTMIVEISLFQSLSRNTKSLIEKEVETHGSFMNQKTEIIWGSSV